MFKPFYVHRNHKSGKRPNTTPRGFTALITQKMDNPHEVFVQITFCSPKDEFNKKEGRSFAKAAPPEVFNKRDIPRVLATASSVCMLPETSERDWYFMYRYVL